MESLCHPNFASPAPLDCIWAPGPTLTYLPSPALRPPLLVESWTSTGLPLDMALPRQHKPFSVGKRLSC